MALVLKAGFSVTTAINFVNSSDNCVNWLNDVVRNI